MKKILCLASQLLILRHLLNQANNETFIEICNLVITIEIVERLGFLKIKNYLPMKVVKQTLI